MRLGIVGHAEDKFTELGKNRAIGCIHSIVHGYHNHDLDMVSREDIVIVSGRCPIGGVDVWAEEQAKLDKFETDIKAPRQNSWNGEYGFKARNLDIAKDSDIVYVILADSFPETFKGKKFTYCYHCKSPDHIKSGACWTAHQAIKLGKKAEWIIIKNN